MSIYRSTGKPRRLMVSCRGTSKITRDPRLCSICAIIRRRASSCSFFRRTGWSTETIKKIQKISEMLMLSPLPLLYVLWEPGVTGRILRCPRTVQSTTTHHGPGLVVWLTITRAWDVLREPVDVFSCVPGCMIVLNLSCCTHTKRGVVLRHHAAATPGSYP